jgi:hypothetical protein
MQLFKRFQNIKLKLTLQKTLKRESSARKTGEKSHLTPVFTKWKLAHISGWQYLFELKLFPKMEPRLPNQVTAKQNLGNTRS